MERFLTASPTATSLSFPLVRSRVISAIYSSRASIWCLISTQICSYSPKSSAPPEAAVVVPSNEIHLSRSIGKRSLRCFSLVRHGICCAALLLRRLAMSASSYVTSFLGEMCAPTAMNSSIRAGSMTVFYFFFGILARAVR